MSQYILPNPYASNWPIPDYVYGDPPGRGALVTRGLARGTRDTNPLPNYSGMAIPQYVVDEPLYPGSTFKTKMLPRGTYSGAIPDPLSDFEATGMLPGTNAAQSPALASWAAHGAQAIVKRLNAVSAAARPAELKKLLDTIDVTLYPSVRTGTSNLGTLKTALQAALLRVAKARAASGDGSAAVMGMGDIGDILSGALQGLLGNPTQKAQAQQIQMLQMQLAQAQQSQFPILPIAIAGGLVVLALVLR